MSICVSKVELNANDRNTSTLQILLAQTEGAVMTERLKIEDRVTKGSFKSW